MEILLEMLTDESISDKLRCLTAGGAKKLLTDFEKVSKVVKIFIFSPVGGPHQAINGMQLFMADR